MSSETTKRRVAAFDFDGTLTRRDTLPRFARFAVGNCRYLSALVKALPAIVAWKLGRITNGQAKERLFGYLYKGMTEETFRRLCRGFVPLIDSDLRPDIMEKFNAHLAAGDAVYIVTASNVGRVKGWAADKGVKAVLGTEAEVSADGRLTGRFSTPNCYGEEKVRRLLQCEPNREEYVLYAYGDSHGDDALLAAADFPYRVV